MAFQLAQAFIDIQARTSRIEAQIGALQQKLSNQMRSMNIGAGVGQIVGSFIGLQAGFAGVLASGREFLEFDKNITNALAIQTGVTNEATAAMKSLAMTMAVQTGQSAAKVAEGFYFLASAGLDMEQQMKALPVAANFATAGLLDMGKATSILNDAQKAAGLSSNNAQENMIGMKRVADVIAKAANISNASIGEMGEAVARAGSAVTTFGASFEESVATLAAFADIGKKAGQGGTAALIVMRDLQSAAIKNAAALRRNSVEVFDATGKFVGMAEVLRRLETAMQGMSDQGRRHLLKTILGLQDRSVQFTASLLGSSDKIKQFTAELERAGGTVDEVAKKQMAGIGKQLTAIGQQFLTLGLNILPPVANAFLAIAQPIGLVAEMIGKFLGVLQGLPAKALAAAAAITLIANSSKVLAVASAAAFKTPIIRNFAASLKDSGASLSKLQGLAAPAAARFATLYNVMYKLSVIGPVLNSAFKALASVVSAIPLIGKPLAAAIRFIGPALSKALGAGLVASVGVSIATSFARGIAKGMQSSMLFQAFIRGADKIHEVFMHLGSIIVKLMDSIGTAIASGLAGFLSWISGGKIDRFGRNVVDVFTRIVDFVAGVLKVLSENWQSTWDIMRETVNIVIFSIRESFFRLIADMAEGLAQIVVKAADFERNRTFGSSAAADVIENTATSLSKAAFGFGVASRKAGDRVVAASDNLGKNWDSMAAAMRKEILGRRGFGPEGRAMVDPRSTANTMAAGAAKALAGVKLELPSFIGLEDLQKQIQDSINKQDEKAQLASMDSKLGELVVATKDTNEKLQAIATNTGLNVPEGKAPAIAPLAAKAFAKSLFQSTGQSRQRVIRRPDSNDAPAPPRAPGS